MGDKPAALLGRHKGFGMKFWIDNVNNQKYADNKTLTPVIKSDNYRCSFEVIELINTLRLDNIIQSVALKRLNEGDYETNKIVYN